MDDKRGPGMDIAVIGLSCAYPGASGADEFWNNIVSGVESLTDLTDEDLLAAGEDADLIRSKEYVRRAACIEGIEMFDAAFFGLTPREAELMDPQHRLFLEHSWRAIEAAGYDPQRFPGSVGVYAGQGANTYLERIRARVDAEALKRTGGRMHSVGSLENDVDYLTPKVSYHLNLTGPSVPVGTACSTSLVAVHLACQALRTFECDAALAGGVAITPPVKRGYVYQEGGIASADGLTRSFDSRSTGTVFGSGVGVVLLKRLEDAIADGDTIEGVIIGSAINNDGAGRAGFTAPSVDGQAELIAAAQAVAGVHPDSITYLEAHGTGTPIGDPIELAALTRAFREQTDRTGYCVLGSVKANIGHMDSAAGVAGLIKALYAIKHGVIPPQLNFREPNEALHLATSPFRITTDREEWHTPDGMPRRAGVSSFGIGGTNAHVIIEQPPVAEPRAAESEGWRVLPVSARDDKALAEALKELADALEGDSARVDDAALTLQNGRGRFACRAAVVARNRGEAARALRDREAEPFRTGQSNPAVAFMFPGQGAHYPGMTRGLYEGMSEFAAEFDRCAELFRPLLGLDPRDLILDEDRVDELNQPRLIQPVLFCVEYALAQALIARGVEPAAMLGHSLGEFVAATVAGVFSLPDAVRVIDARSRFMAGAPDGGMLAVALPEAELASLLPVGAAIAGDNGPRLVAVGGDLEVLAGLESLLTERGVTSRRLRVPYAAHTEAMAEAADRFTAFMATVPTQAPLIPYLSNVTGTWITEADVRSAEYWGRHMRQPVRFRECVANLLVTAGGPMAEVGPGHGLLSLVQSLIAAGTEHRLVRTVRSFDDAEDDLEILHRAFAALWEQGVEPRWETFADDGARRTGLPTYPFQRQRFWVEDVSARSATPAAVQRVRDSGRWLYAPAWRSSTAPRRRPEQDGAAGPVLVVAAAGERAHTLTEAVRLAGHQVVHVESGPDVDPGQALERALAGRARADVLFLSAVDGRAAVGGRSDELLAVVRALAARDDGRFGLLVATSGAFDVSGDEPIVPDHATLAGVAKVVPKELRHVACRVVDLDPAGDAESWARQLSAEIGALSSDLLVAYRGRRRWRQDVEPLELPLPRREQVPLRDKGVYLITGGLGGIGLSIAKFLAREYGATLVLSGRTALPARADWDDFVQAHGADHPTSWAVARLAEIEALGGEVLAVSCDVTHAPAVDMLIRATLDEFGALDGVVHAAGLTGGGGLIERLGPEEFNRTVAPKIAGARALIDATAGLDLRFLALFSSLTTVDSWDGAADYTAGNSFLDALAHQARREGRDDVLAIDWTGWLNIGMNATLQEPAADPGIFLTESEGHEMFCAALAAGLPQIHVSVGDLREVLEQARRFARDGVAAQPPSAPDVKESPAAVTHGHDRPSAVGEFVTPVTPVEWHLAEVFQQVLGFDRIGCADNFFSLGGNSLLALELIGQVRRHYEVQILLRDFFSGPTVSGLATLIEAGRTSGTEEAGR
ncbi:SDR family NAD(P)-dependent oxidoreductase [Sphaerimonospora cavernae]|uniref:SDR family NAD(P)-dependent oxidoreductase n=1 Tax=Sphaerimonospora cavernae TaxID=1740611 RepID=A0ABV6TZ40_9ACTN